MYFMWIQFAHVHMVFQDEQLWNQLKCMYNLYFMLPVCCLNYSLLIYSHSQNLLIQNCNCCQQDGNEMFFILICIALIPPQPNDFSNSFKYSGPSLCYFLPPLCSFLFTLLLTLFFCEEVLNVNIIKSISLHFYDFYSFVSCLRILY